MKAFWNKVVERFRNSFPFKLGVPTLAGGIILGIPVLWVGFDLGLMGDPAYHQALIYLSGFFLCGLMGILWGWFWDKEPDSPDEPR